MGAFNDPPGKRAGEVLLDDVGLVIFDAFPARAEAGRDERPKRDTAREARRDRRTRSKRQRLHEPRPN